MSRPLRAAKGGLIYHTLNRGNTNLEIFSRDSDYAAFEQTLAEAIERGGTRLLAYCLMPTHFHLVLLPRADGELSQFMRWLTLTHTQRWHSHHQTTGTGHVYQGRFRSFPVQADDHFLTVCRYVERNPLRAGLVSKAQDWRWCSLGSRLARSGPVQPLLSPWPVERAKDWTARVNRPFAPTEEEAVRQSIVRGQPFGSEAWQARTAARLGLESTFRPRGRPRKNALADAETPTGKKAPARSVKPGKRP
jgi:putative transposase